MDKETVIIKGFQDWLCKYSRYSKEKNTIMADFVEDVGRDDMYPFKEKLWPDNAPSFEEEQDRLQLYFHFQAGMHNNPVVEKCFKRAWKAYAKERS